MSELSIRLTEAVNREALLRYPELTKQLGASSLISTVSPRLDLKRNTPYPYSFRADESLFPKTSSGFGRIIKKNRQEGIREVHSTIDEQPKEHMWLFLPDESLWIDSTQSADASSVKEDQFLTVFLSYLYDKVELFHTHPDRTVQTLAIDEPWSYSDNYLIEAAQPSTGDLIHCAQMTARTAPESKLTSSIISHFGTTSFSMVQTGDNRGSFYTHTKHQRIIKGGDVDPTAAIRASLEGLSQCLLTYDESPAFSMSFEPL